ncbi:hypothetical protein FJT64_020990 [Amphibalanus amphitrite]|uniref:Uncharacterized protein n=1 Tax=Amphibalanus amphitrite TaxID=1232801 RepID=A0A6A4WK02_AMPAM|nr:hypothetical protein FJT64_020990 [Amphibalanus amphitrite]
MLYPGGFLHVRADGISEKLNAWEWVREAGVYSRLVNLNFFRTLRLRKAFGAWLSSARAHAFSRSRRRVGEALRFQPPYLSVLTTGLAQLRLALDSLRVTPADLPEGVFSVEALATTVHEMSEVATRQSRLAIHLTLDHVHQLCRQLVSDLERAWRHLHQEHCPSTYDSPVLGTARGRVAHLRSRVARCRRLESLLPVFLRLLASLVLAHASASLCSLLEPLTSRLTAERRSLLMIKAEVAQPAAGGGGEEAGTARPQLLIRPDRAQAESRLREMTRDAACMLKLGAERALQPRLEGWAMRQPDTFRSPLASERVNAHEVRFIHVLRDATWGSVEQQTSLITLLTSAMAQDFAIVNDFIENNVWILEAFHHCGVDNARSSKLPSRLTDVITELKQLIAWHSQLDVMPPQLCAGLLQVSLAEVRRKLTESVQRRAAWLLTVVTDALDGARADMRKVMKEVPAEFDGGGAQLSRWFYRITSLIRNTWSRFEPVGTALRCSMLLKHANWQEGHGTAALLEKLDESNKQMTDDWSAYLNALYSRHSALLAELDKRIPHAYRFHESALSAAESVRHQADQLPRWLGHSDVIMKALIPGFDPSMAVRLDKRIGQLLEDVARLTQLMAQLDRVMEEVDEAERVIRLLFHRHVESRPARRTYRRVSEKVGVWTSLRDLLALARLWLMDMRNSELRNLLTADLNAWHQRRRHFISDVAAERQSVRFWRDRMEEVRRLVVMMEAVQGEGTGSDNWSPIVEE